LVRQRLNTNISKMIDTITSNPNTILILISNVELLELKNVI
jgi:hypothetical protein